MDVMGEAQLNRRLLWLTGIRMLIVSTVVVSYVLYSPQRVLTDEGLFNPALGLFIALISIQSLIYLALLRLLHDRPRLQAWIQLLGDLSLITLLIHQLDEAYQFSTLYVLVITVAALFLQRTGVLIIAGLAYVSYTGIALGWLEAFSVGHGPWLKMPADPDDVFRLAYNLVTHLVGFYGIAILTSYLARSMERSEERLRATHLDLAFLQRLHDDVIQSMSSGLVITDLDGIILSVNPSGEQILGRSRNELVGSHVSRTEIFSASEWQRIAVETCALRVRAETECRRGDGERVLLGFTLTPLRGGTGSEGYTLIFQDLTEWRKLQEKVRIQDRMAAIGQMAAGLAHEVGNPLAAISGSVEILNHSQRGAQRHGLEDDRLLGIILKESRRLDRTLKAFLQFAKPGERRSAEFDVAALLGEETELLRNSDEVLPEHRIEAVLEPPSVKIRADRDQVSQIFWNLARNALRAMPEGGELTVVGRLAGERYRIEFRDTGQGMGAEERAQLFHPFKSFFDGGSGLGMAIVYRIVSEHGGEIRVDSEPGHGSNIIVELPVRAPAAAAEEGVEFHAATADHR